MLICEKIVTLITKIVGLLVFCENLRFRPAGYAYGWGEAAQHRRFFAIVA